MASVGYSHTGILLVGAKTISMISRVQKLGESWQCLARGRNARPIVCRCTKENVPKGLRESHHAYRGKT